nr:S53 family peptidase [uncultured Lichenicoccus sp.]
MSGRPAFMATSCLLSALLFQVLTPPPATARPDILIRGLVSLHSATPPTYAECQAAAGAPCYSPQIIRSVYGLTKLIAAGANGEGQTIVIIDAYGSPTIRQDLEAFDRGYGIPDPPSFRVISPLGTVPWDPATYPDQPGWGGEVSLDVEWAHAMAPGANIVLLTSPVDETEGVQGLPEFLELEQYALDNHLGTVISQSWSATENTLFAAAAGAAGPETVAAYESFYAAAAARHVTVLGSTGDDGTSNPSDAAGTDFYPFPTVGFPASSPWVTAVGGTNLLATATGTYISENVWSDTGCCAGGGGVSQMFKEPLYQALTLPGSAQSTLAGARGIPDISYNAAVGDEFILEYESFPGSGGAGWYGVGGTSEGSPQWAGIVADLNSRLGQPLGFLNPTLYLLGAAGLFDVVGRDITVGNNALVDVPGAVAPGYNATTGWDPASGWGTPDLSDLAPALLLTAMKQTR